MKFSIYLEKLVVFFRPSDKAVPIVNTPIENPVRYDETADALYIYISRGEIDYTEQISESVFVDYDTKGNVCGVELLNVTTEVLASHPISVGAAIVMKEPALRKVTPDIIRLLRENGASQDLIDFAEHHSTPKAAPKISLLIPFRSNGVERQRVFDWLIRYWKSELPDAEIIIGTSNSPVFCKTEALNDAASRAIGQVLVILDADAYLEADVINKCADRIIEELEHHLWFVPYRHLYRLNQEATDKIIESDPTTIKFHHPNKHDLDDDGNKSGYGHRYGAMVMMFPREALDTLGCFDTRFEGWGGEDIAFLRAMDTLYGKHKTTNNDILHLWHPTIGETYRERMWLGQEKEHPNDNLANRYNRATRHPSEMRTLVDEGCNGQKNSSRTSKNK